MKEGTPIPGGETVDSPVVVVETTCNAFKLNARKERPTHASCRQGTTVHARRSRDIPITRHRLRRGANADDIDQALATWAGTLADERPDLLGSIVSEMAKVQVSSHPYGLSGCW
jgi:hypothetical protein